tara:strand:+ start:565 stop:864 length:300 start_codon:yes stop_codon:yes gene_type:complete
MLIRKSIEHLKENQMNYWEHMKFAAGHGIECVKNGLLLIIHSIIPAWFSKAGASLTNKLNKVFTDQNEYLHLKNRVETFKKIVYHYRSKESENLKRDCR